MRQLIKKINTQTIYDNIPEEIKSTKKGFVAGSWVAAEIFKQLNLPINPIAHDIDWFVEVSSLITRDVRFSKTANVNSIYQGVFFGNNRKALSCRYINEEMFSAGYDGINHTHKSMYRIIAAKRLNEIINLVNIEFYIQENSFFYRRIEKLVNNFDINAIQVAIDVATGELYGSEQFWSFCKSLQLEIINAWTPSHSIIRYLKKKKELGCYGDDEFNSKLVVASIVSVGDRARKFGETMHKKALEIKKELNKLGFRIKKTTEKYWSRENNIEQLKTVDLYTIEYFKPENIITSLYELYGGEPEFKIYKNEFRDRKVNIRYSNTELFVETFHPGKIWNVANLAWRGSQKQKDMTKSFFEKNAQNASVYKEKYKLINRSLNHREANITTRKIKFYTAPFDNPVPFMIQKQKYETMLEPVERLAMKYNSAVLVYAAAVCKTVEDYKYVEMFLNTIQNEFGQISIGILEASHDQGKKGFFDSKSAPTFEELKKQKYNRAFAYVRRELKKEKGLLSKKLFDDQVVNDVHIRDLVSRIELLEEGNSQHHCVAGYYNSVNSGYTKIFSVSESGNPKITFEAKKMTDQKTKEVFLYIVQAKIKFNQEPELKWLRRAIKTLEKKIGISIYYARLVEPKKRKNTSRLKSLKF